MQQIVCFVATTRRKYYDFQAENKKNKEQKGHWNYLCILVKKIRYILINCVKHKILEKEFVLALDQAEKESDLMSVINTNTI